MQRQVRWLAGRMVCLLCLLCIRISNQLSPALLRAPAVAVRGPASRRLISTTPADSKPRSWKNTAARLGLAIGAVYYYNTSPIFAQTPSFSLLSQATSDPEPDTTLTLDSVKPKIREEKKASAPAPAPTPAPQDAQPSSDPSLMSPEELEAEAGQEGAFNPETGEINWDCPCLGGMAHGPCGEEFKAAFSCFVYSSEEPKGIDCIDKFQGMQNCFRQHPDVYGAELEDDEAAPAAPETGDEQPVTAAQIDAAPLPEEKRAQAQEIVAQTKQELTEKGELAESEVLVPKAAHDAEN
ncbi:intermembrane space protein [Aspergillus sclerotioniger CBS 115572]|uniref:Mitochondrial intermembrane space import and assembly protein 40 n=1 Tax=Aspergillus sclerotioniger CBS 115572 TaxID=1450535 RepID=A0A317XCH4_9EURO|nr:intermembrane space protein [Aspergillus sclerotioniger CBS 115572]PWY96306.1 intermembrane space protein [Aspergillus sclerotioniger CBS 115572]